MVLFVTATLVSMAKQQGFQNKIKDTFLDLVLLYFVSPCLQDLLKHERTRTNTHTHPYKTKKKTKNICCLFELSCSYAKGIKWCAFCDWKINFSGSLFPSRMWFIHPGSNIYSLKWKQKPEPGLHFNATLTLIYCPSATAQTFSPWIGPDNMNKWVKDSMLLLI